MEKSVSAVRVAALLNHLGLDKAHVGACMSGDWGDLLARYAGKIATLTIIAPHLNKGVPAAVAGFPSPTLVIAGDEGAPADRARSLAARFQKAELVHLPGYSSPMWADTVADRTAEVAAALIGFLERAEEKNPLSAVALAEGEGNFEGVRYRIRGRGSPLLLFPLSLAPSQWEPLLDEISDKYCTVTLSGAHLGPVALLESRANSGYGALAARVVDSAQFGPGEVALEVGCGSGALSRSLARRMPKSSRIVATDLNAFLLAEARALAEAQGAGGQISFEEMNAEDIRYPDQHFDVSMSCTVMEEGDADQMLSELARVTRPGGRIVVMTRAVDVDWFVNFPLSSDLRKKLNANGPGTGSGVGAAGCADASLYARLVKAGIKPLSIGPQYAIYQQGERFEDVAARLTATLSDREADICRDALRRAQNDAILFIAEPFHCALGEPLSGLR